MIITNIVLVCDGCGHATDTKVVNGRIKYPESEGWRIQRWVPGLLKNTERRPDKHYCGLCAKMGHEVPVDSKP